MVLALFLDLHGVRVTLFNSELSTRWHPKGSTHNARTMEHYRRLGISNAVRLLGLPPEHPRDIAYFTRLCGWELARFTGPSEIERVAQELDAPDTDQVPEPLLRANQMYVEEYLLEHLRTRPNITLRFGWTVTAIHQDSWCVSLTAAQAGNADGSEQWRADYMVGCDGGHSSVRRALGIELIGQEGGSDGFLNGRMFSSYLKIPALARDIIADRKAWMYNVMAPGLRMLLISLNGEDEFLLMTKPSTSQDMPDDQRIVRHVREGIGRDIDVQILAHAAWNGGMALVAERFSVGRIFLAGDAIHLFSPTGGFGMNTGIDGATNLAWKLAAAIQGWAGPRLLQSYEAERRPIAYRNTAVARFLAQRAGDFSVPRQAEQPGAQGDQARRELSDRLQVFRGQFASLGVELGARYDGSSVIWPDGSPPPDDPLIYQPSGVPGGRLPHLWMDSAGGSRQSIFDLLHPGFTLLRIGPDAPDVHEFQRAAERRGIPLRILDVDAAAAPALYEKRLILVRPDQYIAWRSDGIPAKVQDIMDHVSGWTEGGN